MNDNNDINKLLLNTQCLYVNKAYVIQLQKFQQNFSEINTNKSSSVFHPVQQT